MTKVEKLEREVQKLSRAEFAAFREWFSEYDSSEWDRQIEEDAQAGSIGSRKRPLRLTRLERQKDFEAFCLACFWACYRRLPGDARELADKNFELLKVNPSHPSLRFKKIGRYTAGRVGLRYRALAVEVLEGLVWFWIGNHSEYDKLSG